MLDPFKLGCLLLQAHLRDTEATRGKEERQGREGLLAQSDPETRDGRITRLFAAGLSLGKIGREVKLPPGAVANILRRIEREGQSVADVS